MAEPPSESASLPPSGRRLRVCIATRAPFVGGAELAAERLGVGLRRAGHEVCMVVGERGPVWDRLTAAGLRCEHIATPNFSLRGALGYRKARAAIRGLCVRERFSLVHSNDLPTHQIMSDAARGLGIPRLCHHRFPFEGEAIDWFNKHGAERHLFVSRALMGELKAASAKLAASPCAAVYDGLELPPDPTDSDRQAARRELGLPMDQALVLYAGQIIERKGVADLLHAWAKLQERWDGKARLLIIGDDLQGKGAYRREMENLATMLHSSAQFFGFQKNVPRWLIASDVAVVPSHVEPLGNATLEAMSQGLAVIGSDVGGIPEMIVPEETGLLVPAKQPEALAGAIERLLADGALRRRLGGGGRRRCETVFNLDTHIAAVLAEYGKVLGREIVTTGGTQR